MSVTPFLLPSWPRISFRFHLLWGLSKGLKGWRQAKGGSWFVMGTRVQWGCQPPTEKNSSMNPYARRFWYSFRRKEKTIETGFQTADVKRKKVWITKFPNLSKKTPAEAFAPRNLVREHIFSACLHLFSTSWSVVSDNVSKAKIPLKHYFF